MTTTNKKKTASKRGRLREEYSSYPVEVIDWEISYSLSLPGNKKLEPTPFWEHLSLKIDGNILHPQKLAGKSINLHIIGDRRDTDVMEHPDKYDFEPNRVGTLTARGDKIDYLGSIPFDAFSILATLLSAGKIRIVNLHGKVLYRGNASITSISFNRDFDPEDVM
jgi:hypothetical protein